jgi:hypothetical protein
LVDKQDYKRVSAHKWAANFHHNTDGYGGVFYAKRCVLQGGKKHTVYLHRFILNAPRGVEVDHVDRMHTLDCWRFTLRLATHKQNIANKQKTTAMKSSRYKGVHRDHRRGKWVAGIQLNRRSVYLGTFADEEEATLAYNRAALQHFGKFALLNKVEGT